MLEVPMTSIERLYRYDRGRVSFGGVRSKAIVLFALKRVLELQGFDLDDRVDNKSVWSTDELFTRLNEFGRPMRFSPVEDAWKHAYRKTLNVFGSKGVKLRALRESDQLLKAVRLSKSAGLPTLRKKGEVFSKELRRMERIRDDRCAPPPCIAYHRVQHGEKGPKTRLVWGYPLSMTLLEAQFAAPLIEHFLRVQSPMAFGYRKADLWARMIPLTRRERLLGLDYSKFDSSVHPQLILMAFTVLSTWFTAEDRKDGRWDKMVHYFIHTPILMPDGYVYRKHRGVPSGSYFTQLVDSIVNYFILQYMAYRFGMKADGLVLGDDSLIYVEPKFGDKKDFGFLREGGFGLQAVAAIVAEIGVEVSVKKSRYYVGRDRQAIHFLGHVWSKGYPHRDARDLAKRAVYPERYRQGLHAHEVIRQRVLMLLGDAVEGWKVFRAVIKPSRHGVCFTTGLDVDLSDSDVGWYRALIASGTVVKSSYLPYKGLLV